LKIGSLPQDVMVEKGDMCMFLTHRRHRCLLGRR
jgi:hypothetical protein